MTIDDFINDVLRKSVLKRIRIKVDPRESAQHASGYHLSSSYEGYILQETDTTVKVYFINTPAGIEPIQQVDKKHIMGPVGTDTFIQKLVQTLISTGVKSNHPVLKQLEELHNLEFVETYLKQLNLDDRQISELYKKMLLVQNEAVGDSIVNVGKEVAKLAGKAASAFGELPKLVVGGRESALGRAAKFLKTFNINDLIHFDKLSKSTLSEKTPSKGQLVYISGIKGMSLQYDKFKTPYNIVGQFDKPVITETEYSFQFNTVEPSTAKLSYPGGTLDFSPLKDKREGVLCLKAVTKAQETEKRCFAVRVDKAKVRNTYSVTVVNEIPVKSVTPVRLTEVKAGLALLKELQSLSIIDYTKGAELSDEQQGTLMTVAMKIAANKDVKIKVLDTLQDLAKEEAFTRLASERDKYNIIMSKLKEMNVYRE